MTREIVGSPKITVDMPGRGEVEVDFTPPFRVISIPDRLREALHPLPLPDLNSHGEFVDIVLAIIFYLNSLVTDSAPRLVEVCQKLGIDASPPHTTARLVDKLIGADDKLHMKKKMLKSL